VRERLAPEIDGLSGHAYGFVASGINKNNMSALFAVPYDALPLLDPRDIAVKSKQGFLLHFLFSGMKAAAFEEAELLLLMDRIRVKYGVDKKALLRELGDIRSALNTVKRFVDDVVPLAPACRGRQQQQQAVPRDDPVIVVINAALQRVDLFTKKY
jgi:hypothetical protein